MNEGSQEMNSTGEGEDSSGQSDEMLSKSVEEIEAIWKNRFSQRDKAHNAETAALKAQMEALQAAPAKAAEGESPEAARVRQLEAELTAERNARQVLALQSQFPLTAGILGDAMANIPREKLAAMEAGFDSGAGSTPARIDPNAAPRRQTGVQSQGAKPVKEKTKSELLADLKRLAPAFQQSIRDGG